MGDRDPKTPFLILCLSLQFSLFFFFFFGDMWLGSDYEIQFLWMIRAKNIAFNQRDKEDPREPAQGASSNLVSSSSHSILASRLQYRKLVPLKLSPSEWNWGR